MDHKPENKKCQNCKQDFTIEPDDFGFYEKIAVPPPTFCPDCRMQRRFAYRNERTLHRHKCAKTGNSLISCFSSDSPFTVYERDLWWGDEWNPLDFGMEYDISKPFFAQFRELLEKVPHPNLFIGKCVGTNYGNYIGEFRNSYLISASWEGENIYYSSRCNNSKDCMDMFTANNCEFCYEDISSSKCYETFFSQNAEACTSSYLLYDCKNCINCFGCTSLRNKSNCMWNEQLTKDEYTRRFKELDIGNFENLNKAKEKFEKLKSKTIRRFANITNATNVTGDDISHATNSKSCFAVSGDVKDCKYIVNSVGHLHDSYDGYGTGANTEMLYEGMDSGVDGSMELFVVTCWECLNTEYSFNCHGCNDIFGCVGLRKRGYCIFNKQYAKEEYQKLRAQIIEQMNDLPYKDKSGNTYGYGEFFPAELSPFGYNETVAQGYFPLEKQEIESKGYVWIEREKPEYSATITAQELPDNISDTTAEDILKFIVKCVTCKRPYKIIPNEFEFLKRFGLPLPRKCFECRHQERFRKVNPLKLWHRRCMCELDGHAEHSGRCPNEFETSYSPERPEMVYCEKCYQAEVY